MVKNKLWITIALSAAILLTGLLKEVWIGFVFISLSFLSILALYWAFLMIYKYLEDYKWNFEEDFAFFKAHTINSTAITENDFEMSRDVYVKKYKKSLTRDKMIDIFKIIFVLSFAITCIVAMATKVIV